LRCLSFPNLEASVVEACDLIGGSGLAGYGWWIGVAETDGALFGPSLLESLIADIHLVIHERGLLSLWQIAEGSTTSGLATRASTCSSRRMR
jgi:hypothetical protein